MLTSVVLFGVGSPSIVEYEETCRRLGIAIAAGIENRDGEVFLTERDRLRRPEDVDAALLGVGCLCPLFTPGNRRLAVAEAIALGFAFVPALIDPTAVVAASARIGLGSYINVGVAVGAQARIGSHAVLNRHASLGHHAVLGDFVSLGPGAVISGQVTIGAGAMIGAGAVILPKITIGIDAVVGAGAVVTKDVPTRTTVMGNPATAITPSSSTARPKSRASPG